MLREQHFDLVLLDDLRALETGPVGCICTTGNTLTEIYVIMVLAPGPSALILPGYRIPLYRKSGVQE
jgi:hypothetical protein